MNITVLVGYAVACTLGFLISFLIFRGRLLSVVRKTHDDLDMARKKISLEKEEAMSKARDEAKTILDRKKHEVDKQFSQKQSHFDKLENRLLEKEAHIENLERDVRRREDQLSIDQQRVKEIRAKQDQILNDLIDQLEKTAQLSKKEAENLLMLSVEKDIRKRAGKMIKDVEMQAQKVSKQKATEIVLGAIEKIGVEVVSESVTSVVNLENDEMKGRIIGKEGRNIRAFESETGVDVIIDDTPNAVILSAFDPIRREIAKRAMEKLLNDGRIHPARIEELVEKSKSELEQKILEIGEDASDSIGLSFHPEIVRLLGRLHYRTSYGQNMLTHALESARIAENIAVALGVNEQLSKRGALLHDIGKAIDFEMEGTHDDLGAEVCKKYGESDELINCIMAHHEDEEPDTVEAVIVCVADALSSARPGARRESTELFIKRLEQLESIATEFEGVDRAYAIQAGREIRVIVKPEVVGDESMHKIALDIAKKIEEDVTYPGEVKVSVLRETRAFGLAR